MTHEEAIKAIQREIECVKRQGKTGECCRDELGCGACDLVFEDERILEAYDMAIHALEAGKTLYEFVDKIQTTKQKSIPKCKMGENEWGTPIVCAATIDDVDQLMKSLDDFYKKRAEDMDIWIVCEMAKRWIESLKIGV